MRTIILNGVYKHFKGNNYKVLNIAKDSETLADVVVYQALYGKQEIWVRPLDMFLEAVEYNGKVTERFTYVSQNKNQTITLELTEDVKKFLYENEISLIEELKREYPQIELIDKPSDDGSKDIGITILCVGISLSFVILSITRLIGKINTRPRFFVTSQIKDDNGGFIDRKIEMLEPRATKDETLIGVEIEGSNVKVKLLDKSE